MGQVEDLSKARCCFAVVLLNRDDRAKGRFHKLHNTKLVQSSALGQPVGSMCLLSPTFGLGIFALPAVLADAAGWQESDLGK
ncbi:hypothetical protein AAES_110011 [Amazona aestiva]|uniref:Uncharacterized protein n=1 Tax=Amazona aestiva TaxID=12930 RepID=A0A0Q3TF19_AMAAE|nr:hypothetical protein AAES_110011 [Amazona aestiva]